MTYRTTNCYFSPHKRSVIALSQLEKYLTIGIPSYCIHVIYIMTVTEGITRIDLCKSTHAKFLNPGWLLRKHVHSPSRMSTSARVLIQYIRYCIYNNVWTVNSRLSFAKIYPQLNTNSNDLWHTDYIDKATVRACICVQFGPRTTPISHFAKHFF